MLGLVIDGNRQPTMDDVDNWVERKGTVEEAFDGVLAAEGAGDELMVFKYSNAPSFYITKNVVFRLWTEGRYAWLVVVDRRIRDHSVCFRADPDRLQFRYHDHVAVYDAVYDECLYMFTESMVYWDAVNMPVLTPKDAKQRSPGASEYPARTPMAALQRFLENNLKYMVFAVVLGVVCCVMLISTVSNRQTDAGTVSNPVLEKCREILESMRARDLERQKRDL